MKTVRPKLYIQWFGRLDMVYIFFSFSHSFRFFYQWNTMLKIAQMKSTLTEAFRIIFFLRILMWITNKYHLSHKYYMYINMRFLMLTKTIFKCVTRTNFRLCPIANLHANKATTAASVSHISSCVGAFLLGKERKLKQSWHKAVSRAQHIFS